MRIGGRTWGGLVAVVCLAGRASAHFHWFGVLAQGSLGNAVDPAFRTVAATGGKIIGPVVVALLVDRIGVRRLLVLGMLASAAACWVPFIARADIVSLSLASAAIGIGLAPMSVALLLGFSAPAIPTARLATAACIGWTASLAVSLAVNIGLISAAGIRPMLDGVAELLVICALGLLLAFAAGRALGAAAAIALPQRRDEPASWRTVAVVVLATTVLPASGTVPTIAAGFVLPKLPLPAALFAQIGLGMAVAVGLGIAIDRIGLRRGLRGLFVVAVAVELAGLLMPASTPDQLRLILALPWEMAGLVGAPIAIAFLIQHSRMPCFRQFGLTIAGVTLVPWLIDRILALLQWTTLTTWLPVVAAILGWVLLRPTIRAGATT